MELGGRGGIYPQKKNSGAAIGSDAWPVRRQTYGYLPNLEALPPFHYSSKLHVHPLYTAILISNRDTLAYSVKLHLRDGRTDVRTSVRSSLCPLCLSGASILWGERTAMLHRNLRGRG